MARNSDSQRVVSVYGEPAKDEDSTARKRLTRIRRLIGVALIAIISATAVVVFTPSLLNKLLPQLRLSSVVRPPSSVASTPADPESLPAVPIAWEKLDLSAMAADVAQDLKSGKYYYDKRFPGNFGLAIGSWKQALARLGAADRDGVQRLIAAAERELAGQFSSDSGDAVVLLKQGKRDQAIILLEKMRADFPAIASPQYAWASVMLSRQRR
jgi:hypothetical protein